MQSTTVFVNLILLMLCWYSTAHLRLVVRHAALTLLPQRWLVGSLACRTVTIRVSCLVSLSVGLSIMLVRLWASSFDGWLVGLLVD